MQLSLFTEPAEDRLHVKAGTAKSGTKKGSRRTAKPGARSAPTRREAVPEPGVARRERRRAETLALPFDDPPEAEDSPDPPPLELPPALPAVVVPPKPVPPVPAADLFSWLEEEDAAPKRILFDPQVWQLRPDSGDFIHTRTGEVREEDDFQAIETDDVPEMFSDGEAD